MAPDRSESPHGAPPNYMIRLRNIRDPSRPLVSRKRGSVCKNLAARTTTDEIRSREICSLAVPKFRNIRRNMGCPTIIIQLGRWWLFRTILIYVLLLSFPPQILHIAALRWVECGAEPDISSKHVRREGVRAFRLGKSSWVTMPRNLMTGKNPHPSTLVHGISKNTLPGQNNTVLPTKFLAIFIEARYNWGDAWHLELAGAFMFSGMRFSPRLPHPSSQ